MTNEYIHLSTPHNSESIKLSSLFEKYFHDPASAQNFLNITSNQNYYYWDKVKYLQPIKNFTIEESWLLIRELRRISSTATPIKSKDGAYFTWFRPSYTDRLLREIDMHTGGTFLTDQDSTREHSTRQKYIARGIMEESIASSQLEGANTATKYARKMLTEHIKPRNKDDQMVLNNYQVLQAIESKYKNQPLSIELLQQLQADLTLDTLSDGFFPGQFRKDTDNIVVWYGDNIAHTPPSADFVQKQLAKLIAYANDDTEFIHPIIKAIQLHFWLGYLHPFPDGNGRLARNIFYWYLSKHQYWAMSYLPISTILKRSAKKYTYAYIYAEQDNCDFTYFFDYHIKCIIESISQFQDYLNKQSTENQAIFQQLSSIYPTLNDRQIRTLIYLLKSNSTYTTATSYSTMHAVSYRTALSDLKVLKSLSLIESKRVEKTVQYHATDKLQQSATLHI